LAEKFVTEWGKPVIPMSQCQDTCVVYLPNDFNETCDRRNYDFGCAMKSGFAYVTGMDFLSYEAKPEIILQDINAVESKKQEDAVAYQNKVREERNDALNKSLMR
jgi:hypothetical protein